MWKKCTSHCFTAIKGNAANQLYESPGLRSPLSAFSAAPSHFQIEFHAKVSLAANADITHTHTDTRTRARACAHAHAHTVVLTHLCR